MVLVCFPNEAILTIKAYEHKKVCISFILTRLKPYSARFIYEMLEIHVCPLVSYFVFLLSKVITEKKIILYLVSLSTFR